MADNFKGNAQTTGTVAVGGSVTGDIEYGGDRDWFAVELEAGKTYQFDMKGSWTGDGTLRRTKLGGIHDADGNHIAGTAHEAVGCNSRVRFTATEDGTHYVAAGAVTTLWKLFPVELCGTYTLSAEENRGRHLNSRGPPARCPSRYRPSPAGSPFAPRAVDSPRHTGRTPNPQVTGFTLRCSASPRQEESPEHDVYQCVKRTFRLPLTARITPGKQASCPRSRGARAAPRADMARHAPNGDFGIGLTPPARRFPGWGSSETMRAGLRHGCTGRRRW